MGKIKAVIFDMDGVLIDAKEWHYEALNKALDLFGNKISRYDHLVTYDGLPTRKKLDMISKEKSLPYKLHELINFMKQKYTLEIAYTKCKPVFHVEFAVNELKRRGYRLSVASNSVKDTIEFMLSRANILNQFEFYLSNQDVKEGKPNPEIYNNAIKMMKLIPSECLIIEDNEHGLKAAKDSGAWVLKINNFEEVNFDNIYSKIEQINSASS
tara:strand:+ start:485 stop:1120 length:636 start_codon:yes stop_codon:yes gene_type:complete